MSKDTSDDFKATFVVDLDPDAVWERLIKPVAGFEAKTADGARHLLPGFPTFEPAPEPGAQCTEIEMDPGRMLRVKKDHEPCAGTEILIVLESVDMGTEVTIVQSGFPPYLQQAKDVRDTHGREIVADLQIYLETGVRVPPRGWGAGIGGWTRETSAGLKVVSLDPEGLFTSVGIQEGDLLLTLRGARIYNTSQLWAVQQASIPGDAAELTWLRGSTRMNGAGTFS
jgi:hypothetical protein